MGAKTKLTKSVIEAICKAHEMGAGPMAAAKAGGISHTTYFDWYNNNVAFSEPVKKAREIGESLIRERNLAIIQQAAAGKDGDDSRSPVWQAAAWILERKFPKEFGRFERQEHSGEMGVKINIIKKSVDDGTDDRPPRDIE